MVPKVKKSCCVKNDKLDKVVYTWFKVNRKSNVSISGAILKEKAQQVLSKIENLPELEW